MLRKALALFLVVFLLAALGTVVLAQAPLVEVTDSSVALSSLDQVATFVYGYVAVEQITLYREPHEDADTYPNYIRAAGSTRTVGRFFVMKDAILRVEPVNDTFGKVVTDSTWAVYEGVTVYVRLSDLSLIDPAQFEPLGYIKNPGSQKYVVVNIGERTVALMEGDVVVYKGPAVMNPRVPTPDDPEGNPRGSWLISQTSVSRDMPPHEQLSGNTWPGFPGVSWAALIDEPRQAGYWLHSSAWFHWDIMGPREIMEYRTGGCVSSPAWLVDVPGVGEIRPDVLLWRWVGGNPKAGNSTRYRLPEIVRVFVVDDALEIQSGVFRNTLRATNVNVMDFYTNLTEAELIVPDGYYERGKQ